MIIERIQGFILAADCVNSMGRNIKTDTRRVVCGLTLVLYCVLLPRSSFGFVFATLDSNGVPVSNQTTGVPITWTLSMVNELVGFGNFPQGFVATNGSSSWDGNALQALQEWTAVERSRFRFNGIARVGDLCASGNGEANSGWAGDNCGQSFGDIIAVTRILWRVSGTRAEIVDADVILNSALSWDAYDGPTRVSPSGQVTYDFRRTALHEFGHVLGLGHPDLAGQSVNAVMNSTSGPGSDPDRLTVDDKNGVIALYTSAESQDEGGGGGGSSFDAGLITLILLVSGLRSRRDRKARLQRRSVIGLQRGGVISLDK